MVHVANLNLLSLTLCLDNNFGEKRKKRKGKWVKEKEGKRNRRKVTLVCLERKGRKRKEDKSFSFKSFQLLERLIPQQKSSVQSFQIPTLQIPSLPICYPNKRFIIPPKSLLFLSLNFLPSKYNLKLWHCYPQHFKIWGSQKSFHVRQILY